MPQESKQPRKPEPKPDSKRTSESNQSSGITDKTSSKMKAKIDSLKSLAEYEIKDLVEDTEKKVRERIEIYG